MLLQVFHYFDLIKYLEISISFAVRPQSSRWGLEGYKAPTNDWHLIKTKTFMLTGKKENFMETQARRKKDLPAPTAYKMKSEWSGLYKDGNGHSGRWLKGDKITLIDDILK
jgi:hypothetical protein